MRRGDEGWVRWEDGTVQQYRVTGASGRNGTPVVWLTGPLKGRRAYPATSLLREARV